MANAKDCRHETLAHNGVAHVQRCLDCGGISVHLGPVSIRLDESSLEALWAVLGEAAMELHARKASDLTYVARRGVA
ncbi:hypothetical protein WME90_06630 [Sorangium sp. So ce375]|uniref:hypothetical protein n=1 Tax=Sorangium sp. So ce375 TaxID=3133306 RepID=UPI003F5B00C7